MLWLIMSLKVVGLTYTGFARLTKTYLLHPLASSLLFFSLHVGQSWSRQRQPVSTLSDSEVLELVECRKLSVHTLEKEVDASRGN